MATAEPQRAPLPYLDKPNGSPMSHFTAVNGRDAPEPPKPNAVNGNLPHKSSEERSNGQPRVTAPGQEKLTITTTTRREDWPQPPAKGDRISLPGSSYAPRPAAQSDGQTSNKRKRTDSPDRRTTSASASPHARHALSQSPEKPISRDSTIDIAKAGSVTADRASQAQTQSDPREQYASTQQNYTYGDGAREGTNGNDAWFSQQSQQQQSHEQRPAYDVQGSAQVQGLHPDDQLREALARETQGMESHGGYHGNTSPEDDDGQNTPYPGSHGYDRNDVQMHADMKKRKRQFSNRTKTGCLTCRKRKKKCDEERPECTSRKPLYNATLLTW